jgi:hypothetical protein
MKTLVNGLNEPRFLIPIARFGTARLYARPDGGAELHGGAEPERSEAREWISLFAHELGLSFSSSTTEKGTNPRPARTESRLAGIDVP